MRISDLLALPAVLNVPAAGEIVGLRRSAAYSAAQRYLETDGREGLPVLRLGRRLRVPTAVLLRQLGIDAFAAPAEGSDPAAVV